MARPSTASQCATRRIPYIYSAVYDNPTHLYHSLALAHTTIIIVPPPPIVLACTRLRTSSPFFSQLHYLGFWFLIYLFLLHSFLSGSLWHILFFAWQAYVPFVVTTTTTNERHTHRRHNYLFSIFVLLFALLYHGRRHASSPNVISTTPTFREIQCNRIQMTHTKTDDMI